MKKKKTKQTKEKFPFSLIRNASRERENLGTVVSSDMFPHNG